MREKLFVLIATIHVAAFVAGCTEVPDDTSVHHSNKTKTDEEDTEPSKKKKSASTTAATPLDNCGAITAAGHCTQTNEIEACVTPTNTAKRQLSKKACSVSETCSESGGRAHCEPLPGACVPSAERCASADTMQTCGDDGKWGAATTCRGCSIANGAAVGCTGTLAASAVRTISGKVNYEQHGMNAARTDWDTNGTLVPAQGTTLMSMIANPDVPGTTIPLDVAVIAADGSYTLKVPSKPGATDSVVLFAMSRTPDTNVFAIGLPDVGDGVQSTSDDVPPANERSGIWTFGFAPASLGDNATLNVREQDGAGVLRVFDIIRMAHGKAEIAGGKVDKSLIAFMRPNTEWDCGACFIDFPQAFDGAEWKAQIRFGFTAEDQGYWSDAVTAHEFGHSIMAAYGISPNEGGAHQLTCGVAPGMAWSEGWASGFSSLVRANPLYFDKQGGSFFWFDLSRHQYSDGGVWTEATKQGGLFQAIDENIPAAVLWALANHPATGDALTATPELMKALIAVKGPSFGRGYTAKFSEGVCDQMKLTETNEPAPMLADFLDALACSGFDKARIQKAVGSYPYNANTAICPGK